MKMKASGGLSVPVIWAVQIVNTLKTMALFFAWVPTKVGGMRGGMLTMHSIILVLHCLAAIFSYFSIDMGVVICIGVYLFCFSIGIGNMFFVYVTDTTVDCINGMAQQNLYMLILILSAVSPIMVESLGVGGVFVFYSICTFIGLVYQYLFVKETNFRIEEDGSMVELTEKQKKQLYKPTEPISSIAPDVDETV